MHQQLANRAQYQTGYQTLSNALHSARRASATRASSAEWMAARTLATISMTKMPREMSSIVERSCARLDSS